MASPERRFPVAPLWILIGVVAGVLPGHAQPVDCASEPVNQELDFWIGDWDVCATEQLAGRNRIERALGGCVLIERWTSAAGSSGTSLNWVDRSTAETPRWRQLWVDQNGATLDYTRRAMTASWGWSTGTRGRVPRGSRR